jgi:hypothetical protein
MIQVAVTLTHERTVTHTGTLIVEAVDVVEAEKQVRQMVQDGTIRWGSGPVNFGAPYGSETIEIHDSEEVR